MKSYPLAQAAARAGITERTFQHFYLKGVVHPTAETRTAPRGVPKQYSAGELAIAYIAGKLMQFGVTTTLLADLGDWLRSHTGGQFFREARAKKPIYVRLSIRPPDAWSGDFETARALTNGDERFVSITEPNQNDHKQHAELLILINLADVLSKTEEEVLLIYRDGGLKPSDAASILAEHSPPIHTTEEIEEIKATLAKLVAEGDAWPVADIS